MPPREPPSLLTTAEQSQWKRTGRYDEAVRLCRDFARVYPGVGCEEIGRTGQDRPIVVLRIARKAALPVIYIQAGIHAGEIEGKDAGFWFLRHLLAGMVARGALDHVSIVFVPVVNPDGHERFGPNHRPNQRGPEEMGFRTNGARQNINRDFVKADTPEMQALLRVITRWDPTLFIDRHATDGAKFEHDVSVIVAPLAPRGDELEETAATLSDVIQRGLTARGHLPVPFYPSFIDEADPASGFEVGEAPPRFSNWYMAARGRLGVLVETHSWRTFGERARATYHVLETVLAEAIRSASRWRAVADQTSRASAALGGSKLTLGWKTGPRTRPLAFRGYAYEKRPSEISGSTWLVYDETKPEVWNVPLHDELIPDVTVDVPRGGYIVDGGFAKLVGAILDHHGIHYQPVGGTHAVETMRARKVTYLPPFEGRTRTTIEGAWAGETRKLEQHAIFVPIAQPLARLVVHLFDPALPDSLAAWGHFNVAFEQKEYMEAYVVEEQARAMLAADPTLQATFDQAIAADPELAKSPARRLAWFYHQHPAWDERVNLLPVYRIAAPPR
ncbi:MAG: M14 family zinc carboxypeptidase [Kofleriaceae bacterium]